MFCNCTEKIREISDKYEGLLKSYVFLEQNFELLMQHLKLEVNDIPATERKRVIVKLGTHAKKMKESEKIITHAGLMDAAGSQLSTYEPKPLNMY